ncbi:MAG: amidinotransferase [Ignavibacteria bacterium]|nr:amidinotransferase [Ignavibacteria bacterium]
MISRITNNILMISPNSFGYNFQAAKSNSFQNRPEYDIETIRQKAIFEFNEMAKKLTNSGVNVHVLSNDDKYELPDAVFPNNWFCTYQDGTVILFPMLNENRRLERDQNMLKEIFDTSDFKVNRYIDYSKYEDQNIILEGTGSLVLDRKNNAVFAIESERTNKILFDKYCNEMEIPYENRIFFHANDLEGKPIYHTNVIMSVCDGFAVICRECIQESEQDYVLEKLKHLNLEIIEITYFQLKNFCGNILNIANNEGESLIVLSVSAAKSFEKNQIEILKKFGKLIEVNINTIESIGGGSARCMIAEIFLPKI